MPQSTPAIINPGQADPLAQLRDIHLPGPIEAWPPAPGWIVLAILATAALVAASVWLYRTWRRNQYRRDGLKALQSIRENYQLTGDTRACLEDCARLLKRIALTRYPRTTVASLTGEAWVQFLDKTASTHEFSMGAGQVLIEGCYEQDPEIAVDELFDVASHWITQHGEMERAA